MPIVAFENTREAPLILVIEPSGERHEIPHLSIVGIRYASMEGEEDRCYCDVSEGQIDFWCDAESPEIDIVHASAFNKLLWDICVGGGWCGGIVDGEPTCVEDLLPETGMVTAEDFAKLVVRADGWPESEPFEDKHLRSLEAAFIEHLGAPSVHVDELRRDVRRPFDTRLREDMDPRTAGGD